MNKRYVNILLERNLVLEDIDGDTIVENVMKGAGLKFADEGDAS